MGSRVQSFWDTGLPMRTGHEDASLLLKQAARQTDTKKHSLYRSHVESTWHNTLNRKRVQRILIDTGLVQLHIVYHAPQHALL